MAEDIVSRLVLSTGQFNSALDASNQRVKRFAGDSARAVQTFGDKLRNIGTLANSVAGLAIFGTITKGLKDSTSAAIAFESAFAGVRKTVDETEAGFQQLITNFTELSTITPVSREELSKIGELAGQLGVRGVDNLTKFTETIARISVSTNLSAEQAATNFAKFANVVQLPLDQVDRLGASIVALGNNFATTEADISNMSQNLAASGKVIGLSADEILGFSAALSSVGIEAEAGGTSFSKVFIKLAEAASQGNEAMAAFTGHTVESFRALVQNNPAEAVLQFIESLGRVKQEGGDVFAVIDELDLKEVRLRNALLSTANAGDLVRRAMELSGKAFQENTALVEESEKRFATSESQLLKLSNAYSNLSAALGEAILPALREFTALMVPIIKGITEWAKENPNLVKGLLAMAGVVAVGGALLVGIGAFALVMTALGAVGGPILIAVGAITALVGAFVGLKDKVPAALTALKDGVVGVLNGIAKGMANGATVVVNGVANILKAINEFLEAFPSRAFASGVALVDSFAKGLASRADAAVDAVAEMVGKVREYLPFSPAKVGPLQDLDKSGEALGQTWAEGIERGADQPVQAVQAMAAQVKAELEPTADDFFNALHAIEELTFELPVYDEIKRINDVLLNGTPSADDFYSALHAIEELTFELPVYDQLKKINDTLIDGTGATKSAITATNELSEAQGNLNDRLKTELDIRGSVPTRASNGQFQGAIQRTGTGFLDGGEAALTSFVARAQDSFAQGVTIAEAGINAMNQAVDGFSTDLVEGKIRNLGDVFKGLRDIAVETIKEIAQEMIKLAIIQTIASAIGGGLSGAVGGGGIAGANARGAANPALFGPGFASGGSFMVGGPGGTDRTPIGFMASRGERVTVETPAQQQRGGMTVNVINNAGAEVQARESQDGRSMDIYVERKIQQSNRNGSGRKATAAAFGLPIRGRVG